MDKLFFYGSLSDIELFQVDGTDSKLHGTGWEPHEHVGNLMGQVGNPLSKPFFHENT